MNHDRKTKILKKRIEIYQDFILTLIDNVFKYYVDKESINTQEIMENHFEYCFNKTNDLFKLEGIDFSTNNELKSYFFNYLHRNFYDSENVFEKKYFINFWKNFFDVDKVSKKRNSGEIVQTISAIINVFEKSMNKNENIFNYL